MIYEFTPVIFEYLHYFMHPTQDDIWPMTHKNVPVPQCKMQVIAERTVWG